MGIGTTKTVAADPCKPFRRVKRLGGTSTAARRKDPPRAGLLWGTIVLPLCHVPYV